MFPKTTILFFLLLFLTAGELLAQPARLNYFRDNDSAWKSAALDPGDLLLQQSVLLTNQYGAGNISFQLSFDREAWGRYGLGPLYSSVFSLKNQQGCYFVVTTSFGDGREIRKEYFLNRGRCYSVYWNRMENCWDMKENRCRR